MVNLEGLMIVMEETKDNCNHQCGNCPMYLPSRDECFHSANKKWEEWNRKAHEKFGEMK